MNKNEYSILQKKFKKILKTYQANLIIINFTYIPFSKFLFNPHGNALFSPNGEDKHLEQDAFKTKLKQKILSVRQCKENECEYPRSCFLNNEHVKEIINDDELTIEELIVFERCFGNYLQDKYLIEKENFRHYFASNLRTREKDLKEIGSDLEKYNFDLEFEKINNIENCMLSKIISIKSLENYLIDFDDFLVKK